MIGKPVIIGRDDIRPVTRIEVTVVQHLLTGGLREFSQLGFRQHHIETGSQLPDPRPSRDELFLSDQTIPMNRTGSTTSIDEQHDEYRSAGMNIRRDDEMTLQEELIENRHDNERTERSNPHSHRHQWRHH